MNLITLASPGFFIAHGLLLGIGVSLPLSSSIRYITPLLTLPLAYYQSAYAPYFTTSDFYGLAFGAHAFPAWIIGLKALWELDMVDTFSKGFNILLNSRGIGTPFLVKNLPSYPKYYGGVPSRMKFIVRESCFVAWSYLAVDLMLTKDRHTSFEEKQEMFGHGQEYQFLSLTKEKLAFRFMMSNISWFIGARIMLSGLARVYQLALVIFGGDPVDSPTMFGSMWDVYSVRQFWVCLLPDNPISGALLCTKTSMQDFFII